MLDTIRSTWVWTGNPDADLAATVRFSILPDGRIANVRIETKSGNPYYDQSVLNAVRGVTSVGPPPPEYRNEFSEFEITFRPSNAP